MSHPEKLLLLDTASLYYRAFFGVPDRVYARDGTSVNAVRGLLDMIAKLTTTFRPTHLVACWDDDWRPQWRVDLIPTYKAHRVVATDDGSSHLEDTPEALRTQIPLIRTVLSALNVVVVGAAGFEADDIIGTLTARSSIPVDIVTGDRDLFQLIDDERRVRVINTARGMNKLEVVTNDVLIEKYGVRADQYADFATLRGDASDGLPGVAGVGEKTAATLLRTYGNLSEIRAAAASGTALTAKQRAQFAESSAYLDAAPRVVAVEQSVPIADVSGKIVGLTAAAREHALALAEQWNLGSPLERVLHALEQASASEL